MKPPKARPKENGRVTAQDVAALLGVSQSTISRAFTATASISDEMKQRVVKACLELGYQPNAIARSLITRRTNIVAIVIGNLTDPFYTTLLRILTERLQDIGKQVLLFTSPPGRDIEALLPTLLQYQVDGIVITSATVSSEMASICARRDTPVVLLNRYVPGVPLHVISCDNVQGGRDLARHFVERGFRKLAFVAGQPDASTSLDRQLGFTSGLALSGVSSCIIEQGGDYSYEAGYEAALRLLKSAHRPDAVFFASDIMAFGGMDGFRDKGLDVPGDIAVAGFNDVPQAAWPTYNLTTVGHPYDDMADAVAAVLGFSPQGGQPQPAPRLFPGRVIVRASTGARATATADNM